MTANQFRKMVLGLDGVVEASHMNHPDFRYNNRIFATLNEDETRGMVSLTPEQQAEFMADHPEMFTPAAGAWGRGGSTMVILSAAAEDVVGEAMTLAWQNVRTKAAAEPRKTRKRSSSAKTRKGAR